MSKNSMEQAASVLKEIKSEVREDVIKETSISKLSNIAMKKQVGHVVFMTLSTKFNYTSPVLEDWRKRLQAEDFVISVKRNSLQIRFYVTYK